MKVKLTLVGSLLLALFFIYATQSFAQEIKITSDPTRMGIGARMLGMGKAGLSLGDDCTSMFLNPAGIGELKDWQVTSMSGKFVNEIDYLMFNGIYPTNYGNFGIGYVGGSIGAVIPATALVAISSTEYRVIEGTGEAGYNYNNSALLISYGVPLKDIIKWGITQNMTFGANMKIFSQGLTGGELANATASGYNLDLGFIYKLNPWLNLGLTGKNILPASLGGKLVWAEGQEETIPSLVRLGASTKILGKDALYKYGDQELVAAFDTDYSTTNPDVVPMLMHIGLEWWPIQYAALRLGIDQDVVGTGGESLTSTNNLTAGVGLLYGGFRFDYAYHTYNDIPENTTHYFSLSYNIWKEKPKEVPPPAKVYVKIAEPADKTILSNDRVIVSGEVLAEVKTLKVNGVDVPISALKFSAETPLKLGKNLIIVDCLDAKGTKLASISLRVLRLATFKDVEPTFWAKDVIGEIATLGIVGGYPDQTFRPIGSITRAELTTLLVRAKGITLGEITGPVFADVPGTHWAAKFVKGGVDLGYVKGYPDGTFKPAKTINKAEGVTVLSRFAGLEEPKTITEAPFPDVPGRHWAAKMITAAKSAGMLRYLAGRSFEPEADLTRAEAVEILGRTKFATDKIDDLLNFERGYEIKEVR